MATQSKWPTLEEWISLGISIILLLQLGIFIKDVLSR